MSRSRKKTPITGVTCCTSEKQDKRIANRRFRRINKVKLKKEEEDFFPKMMREVSNVYGFGKDGKVWFGTNGNTWLNHNPALPYLEADPIFDVETDSVRSFLRDGRERDKRNKKLMDEYKEKLEYYNKLMRK